MNFIELQIKCNVTRFCYVVSGKIIEFFPCNSFLRNYCYNWKVSILWFKITLKLKLFHLVNLHLLNSNQYCLNLIHNLYKNFNLLYNLFPLCNAIKVYLTNIFLIKTINLKLIQVIKISNIYSFKIQHAHCASYYSKTANINIEHTYAHQIY